jgi:hypothetical protein
MALQNGPPLRLRVNDVLGIVQDGVRLFHLYRVFRRHMCRDHVEHHVTYTPMTAPTNLSQRVEASASAFSLLHGGRSVGRSESSSREHLSVACEDRRRPVDAAGR